MTTLRYRHPYYGHEKITLIHMCLYQRHADGFESHAAAYASTPEEAHAAVDELFSVCATEHRKKQEENT